MTTDKQICVALTKTLHAYEAFMEDIEGEAPKWLDYGDAKYCRLCRLFGVVAPSATNIGCSSCPLYHEKRSNVGCTGKEFDNLYDAVHRINALDAYEGNGIWKSVPTEVERVELKKVLRARYNWVLRRIVKAGYEYK